MALTHSAYLLVEDGIKPPKIRVKLLFIGVRVKIIFLLNMTMDNWRAVMVVIICLASLGLL
ncbi:MAG: hypothetical protein DWP95_00420 [Proteobacteria bacterium]|nr:MAG: hypothetical protein DWP95_00420 [Pseudomonadota bacterium]